MNGGYQWSIVNEWWLPPGNLLHGYWKMTIFFDLPVRHGDFPSVSLPKGKGLGRREMDWNGTYRESS